MTDEHTTARMAECQECGYRPFPEEIDESGGSCPECGFDPAENL